MTQVKCGLSLRSRVGKIVLIFSILIVSFYTTMLAILYDLGLKDASRGILWLESESFKKAYALDKNTPLPKSETLQSFIGEQNIPQNILDIFQGKKWSEFKDPDHAIKYINTRDQGLEHHYHLLKNDLPGTDKTFFIFYEIEVTDKVAAKVWYKFKVIALIGGLLVVIMLCVFRKLIDRTLSPLGSLSDWINNLDDQHLPNDLPPDLSEDEIGLLASRLYQALTRIHDHNAREREFLRNASHELRTPIAIIRNAMDVIEHKRASGNNEIDALLQRIRRAGDTMKSVTEAILWLALDGYSRPSESSTNLETLIRDITEENRKLSIGKNVHIEFDLTPLKNINIECALVQIALDNIIRNAFQHCSDGEIHITAETPYRVVVKNNNSCYYDCTSEKTSVDQAIKSGGFGLGLALVNKIAERQHWDFSFKIEEESAIATLEFSNRVQLPQEDKTDNNEL